MTRAPRLARWIALAVVLVSLLAGAVVWLNLRGEAGLDRPGNPSPPATAVLERGAYLVRAGNCIGCHTAPDGARFAGGPGVETPFGTVFAPNITADPTTGIGTWSSSDFWRAMHHGRSKDGRLLYPAFPYPSFTTVTREDSDALYEYLRSAESVNRANTPHSLRFPYSTQAAVAVWRALFFRPDEFVGQPQESAQWNRGRYLVQGLGHCAACHSGRNFLGGTALNAEFAGSLMPNEAWYAPSLANPKEAGVQGWPLQDMVSLLKDGVSRHGSVAGPMAEVVFNSTQYMNDQDLDAMARYLASIPARQREPAAFERASFDTLDRGAKVYEQHCAACHGDKGQGVPSIYPALAGNRAVTLESPNNVIQVIRKGGFAPSTSGNPQPFGMPPFGQTLTPADAAAVATYVRQSWGNSAPPVSHLDVARVK